MTREPDSYDDEFLFVMTGKHKMLEAEKARIATEQAVICAELLNQFPIAKGDRVEVGGYAHRGKHIVVDRLQVVRERHFGGDEYSLRVVASGRIIKANGEPGERVARTQFMLDGKPSGVLWV
jgi:hypothetical protein